MLGWKTESIFLQCKNPIIFAIIPLSEECILGLDRNSDLLINLADTNTDSDIIDFGIGIIGIGISIS